MSKTRYIVLLGCVGGLTACAHLPQLALHPDGLSPSEHVTLGHTYEARGEKELALREYRAAYDQDAHSYPALMALGETAYNQGAWAKARAYFRKALKGVPGDPSAINNLAMVDLGEGKHLKRARDSLEKALPTAGALKPYLEDTLASIQNVQTK